MTWERAFEQACAEIQDMQTAEFVETYGIIPEVIAIERRTQEILDNWQANLLDL